MYSCIFAEDPRLSVVCCTRSILHRRLLSQKGGNVASDALPKFFHVALVPPQLTPTLEDRKYGYFLIFQHYSCENIQKYFEFLDTPPLFLSNYLTFKRGEASPKF